MSLARIEIEEHRPGFWVAEVEAGYPACRRERLTGGTIVEIVSKVGDAYERMMGRPASLVEQQRASQEAQVPALVAYEARAEAREWTPDDVDEVPVTRQITIGQHIVGVDPPFPAPVFIPAAAPAKSGYKVPRAPAELVAQARAIGIPAKGTWTRARVLREVAKVAEGKA